MTKYLTAEGLIAAALVFIVLFVILSVPLWISFIATGATLLVLPAATAAFMQRSSDSKGPQSQTAGPQYRH
jgi:hypothetical protein